MSEILAAVAREQLRGYPKHLAEVRESVSEFQRGLADVLPADAGLGAGEAVSCCAFTQIVLRIDELALGIDKDALMRELTRNGVPNWHANFELINSLSFFRSRSWRDCNCRAISTAWRRTIPVHSR